MFAVILLMMASLSTPVLELDIPVNLLTGKVDLKDKRPVVQEENTPESFSRHYHYVDGKYRCNHLGKFAAKGYKENNVGIIFEAYIEPFGKVSFLKDSEYTFRPLYGQDFPNPVTSLGGGVNHPDNISIVSTGKFVILTYLDGRKLVYENINLKTKCRCGKDHYNLIKECDGKGNLTKYTFDKYDDVEKVTKLDSLGRELSSLFFKRRVDKKFYNLDLCAKDKKNSYLFKWNRDRYDFIQMKSNNQMVEKMSYKDKKLVSLTDAVHGIYDFEYSDDKVSVFSVTDSNKTKKYNISYFDFSTKVSSHDGNVTYHFDKDHRLVLIDGMNGYQKRLYYNSIGELTKTEYIQDEKIYYSQELYFDSRHNLVKRRDYVDGIEEEEVYEYDHLCRKTKEIDSHGVMTSYSYKENTSLLVKVDRYLEETLVDRVLYEYDDQNRLVKETIKDGQEEVFLFCKIKRYIYRGIKVHKILKSYIDTHTNQEKRLEGKEFIYSKGRVSKIKRLDEFDRIVAKRSFRYDQFSNLIFEKNELGKETSYSYDIYNRLINTKEDKKETTITYLYGETVKTVREELNSGEIITCSLEYDLNGNIEKNDHSINGSREYVCDYYGRIKREGDTLFEYDILNRVKRKIGMDGITIYEYGEGLNPSAIYYPNGTYVTKKRVDDDTYEERSDKGLITTRTYDKLGNLIKECCGDKVYTYEHKGHLLLKKLGPEGFIHNYAYDGAGRVVKEGGAVSAVYGYDCFSNVIYKKTSGIEQYLKFDGASNVIEERTCGKRVSYLYDEDGNIKTKRVGEEVFTYLYDGKGRKIRETLPGDIIHTYSYDGRVCKKTFSTGLKSEESYDRFGNLILIHEEGSDEYSRENTFNNSGRCIKSTFEGKDINYLYNGYLDLLEERVRDGKNVYITSYTYNQNKQLSSKRLPCGAVLYYTYDEYGRDASIKSSDNTVHYEISYDLLDRIIFVKDNVSGCDIERKYNISGDLIEESFGEGRRLRFSYQNGLRKRCELDGKGCIEYQYAKNGNLVSIDRYNKDGSYLYSHQYEYNLFGDNDKESLPFNLFQTRNEYRYGRCVQKSSPFHSSKIHIENDLVTKLDRKEDSILFSYDRNHQIIKEEIDLSMLTFDDCGRVTFDGINNYSYDAMDRVIYVRNKNTKKSESYCYDYFGRLRRKEGDSVSSYIYDGENEIGDLKSLAIIDYKTNKKVAIEIEGEVFVPLYDVFMSLVGIVDTKTKKLKEIYTYDAFGEEKNLLKRKHINPWRYKGLRKFCFNTLIPFGNRNYSPKLKIFLSRDPLKQSFHLSPYIYCYNNPLSYEDTDGLSAAPFSLDPHDGNYLAPLVRNKLQEAFSFDQQIDKKIYFVNGLKTNQNYLNASADFMQQFFNQSITPYYRSCGDSFFGLIAEFFGSTKKARTLATSIKEDLQTGVNEVYLFGHSAGGSTIKSALRLLSKKERKKLNIITFGSAALINPSQVKSATNYYSSRDHLLKLFQIAFHPYDYTCYATIIPSEENSGSMDHSLMDLTYRKRWIQNLSEIKIY